MFLSILTPFHTQELKSLLSGVPEVLGPGCTLPGQLWPCSSHTICHENSCSQTTYRSCTTKGIIDNWEEVGWEGSQVEQSVKCNG